MRKNCCIRFSDDEKATLRNLAQRMERTESDVVRLLVRHAASGKIKVVQPLMVDEPYQPQPLEVPQWPTQ